MEEWDFDLISLTEWLLVVKSIKSSLQCLELSFGCRVKSHLALPRVLNLFYFYLNFDFKLR